jgi:dienelactone hydrolase
VPTPPTAQSFIALLGGFPAKPPLEVQVLHEHKGEGYTRQLIEYTGAGVTRIPAFLLRPRPNPRATTRQRPGVVAIHQDGDRTHRRFGKSEVAGLLGDPDQCYGAELARRGYVVLCPDRPGFEDRQGRPASLGGLRGELFELHRAVDCLLAQPDVDGERLGVIGHSAGGWLASWLLFTDQRVGAGAVSCGALLGRWCAIPKDQLPPGYNIPRPHTPDWGDQDDILAGIAPRPYFETRGDSLGPTYDEELTRKACARYAALGVAERFVYLASYALVHAFPTEQRERAYAWLDRWLDHSLPAVESPAHSPEV